MAARLTFALGLILTFAVTVVRPTTMRGSADLAVYWGLVLVDAHVAFSRRWSERQRALFVTGSWGLAGLEALATTGLGSGPPILTITVGLAGLFFGLRAALATAAAAALALVGVAWTDLARADAGAPGWLGPGTLGDWLSHGVTIVGISLMAALVQAATLRRAALATERARHFALVVELTDNTVMVTGPDSRIEWVNDAFTRLTGWSAEAAIGRMAVDLFTGPATDPETLRFIGERIAAAEGFTCELVNYTRDGRPYWVSLEVRPFLDSGGRLSGFTSIEVDVTEARMSRELARLDASLGALFTSDRDEASILTALVERLGTLSPVRAVRIYRSDACGAWVRAAGKDEAAEDAASAHRHVFDVPAEQPGEPQFRFEVLFEPDMPGHAPVIARMPVIGVRLRSLCAARVERLRFEALFEHSPDAMLLLDAVGIVRQLNARAASLCSGIGSGRPLTDWVPGFGPLLVQLRAQESVAGAAVASLVWQQALPSGGLADLEATLANIDLPDARGVLVAVRDTTARRQAERALEASLAEASRSLAEREVLLGEVHHRVKNNLQIVSSLLSMQAERSSSEETRAGLLESVHRVRSMALIHRMLYGNVNLAEVDIAHYALAMARDLGGSLGGGVPIRVQSQALHLTVDQAIPFGLILNELLTNALKHGHRAGERSDVSVRISVDDADACLRVVDRGPGLPEGFDWRGTSSLGAVIVDALTRQVGGTLTVRNDPGACFELRLPVRRTGPAEAGKLDGSTPVPAA